MSKILTLMCFCLSTEWYGVDIRPHCHAERVSATFCFFFNTKFFIRTRSSHIAQQRRADTLYINTYIHTSMYTSRTLHMLQQLRRARLMSSHNLRLTRPHALDLIITSD